MSTHQILKLSFVDMSVFERKRIKRVGFGKKASDFVLKFYKASDLEMKEIFTASDLVLKVLKRVRFGFGKIFDASDFEFKRDDALDYEMKVSLRIKFEKKFFSGQILTYKLYNLPDLEIKNLQYVTFWIYLLKPVRFCIEKKQHVRFWYWYISTSSFLKTIALKSHVLSFQSMKTTFFCSFRAFLEQTFREESFTTCQILNWKENNAWNFEQKEQRNRFWLNQFTRCQFLYLKNVNTSDFEIEFHWHVSIWKKKNKTRWISKKGVRFCVKVLQSVRFGNEGNFYRVRFSVKSFETRQIWIRKKFWRVRLWI